MKIEGKEIRAAKFSLVFSDSLLVIFWHILCALIKSSSLPYLILYVS